jgi:hypothetical protein
MYMSSLDAGSFWPLFSASELLPGECRGAHLQVSLLVSCSLCALAGVAACCCWLIVSIAHIIIVVTIIIIIIVINICS